ncbi:MAG: hypothetical protein WC325_11485, partial [Candidatus Bathyarchaeia archaeon]
MSSQETVNQIVSGGCETELAKLPDESIDCCVTDPPYGYSFMGKDWDRAVPHVGVWRGVLRVLKSGAFAFVMCAPRQDCLSRMIVNLQDAGFRTDFTPIYWTYASGFPKSENIELQLDKRACKKEFVLKFGRKPSKDEFKEAWKTFRNVTGESKPVTVDAKLLDGSYG